MRAPALATLDPSLGARVRTVVLREAQAEDWSVVCFTDERAGKARNVRIDGRVEWMFYDPGERTQIRLSGTTEIHNRDGVALGYWAEVPEWSRANYRSDAAPGSDTLDVADRKSPDDAAGDIGFYNFAVLRTRITEIDWLLLGRPVHERVRLERLHLGWYGRRIAP